MKSRHQMTALVTGGAGFIGSNLCEKLINDGANVICLDNFITGREENLRSIRDSARFALVEHDVIDPLPLWLCGGRTKVSHIYHLACPASPVHYQADPERTLLTNVLGTRNLLRMAEQTGARFLLASTSEVYGDPEVHPQREDYCGRVSCTGPRACYDEGKRAAETLTFDFLRAGRANVRVARIFNTYGPKMRSDDGRVISNIVCQALSDAAISIYGDGSQTRSFCFVSDMVEGLTLLINKDCRETMPFNLGNPYELSVRELVDLVIQMTGSRSPIVNLALPVDDPRRRNPDISRARDRLGWWPKTDLKSGLEATIAWFEAEQKGTFGSCFEPCGETAVAAE